MHQYGDLSPENKNTREVFNYPLNSSDGATITENIECQWSDRNTYTPAKHANHPSDSNFKLITAERQRTKAGLCLITLTYMAESTGAEYPPATTYFEQGNSVSVPIQQHPDFADWADEWDDEENKFLPTSSKYGISSYIVGSKTVTKTEYFALLPSDPTDDIGTKESPGGGFGGSGANWLVRSATRGKQGVWFTRVKIYEYSAIPYNTDIYPD